MKSVNQHFPSYSALMRTWCSTRVNCGATFFNISICDSFYLFDAWETANYADDTTPYTTGMTIADVIS